MRQIRSGMFAIAVMAALSSAALAEEKGEGDKRFSMSPVDGGMLRLDRETGAVSLCARKAEAWSCEPVEDRGKSLEDKLKTLDDENKNLKAQIETLSSMLDEQSKGAKGPPSGSVQIPSEEEIDKGLDYVERLFRKFRDRLKKLDEAPRAPDAKPTPDGGGNL